MNNKSYYEHSGRISNGPSREAMFDSLRLGITVEVMFTRTDREIVLKKALVISVKKLEKKKQHATHKWLIALLFSEEYSNTNEENYDFLWSGYYSTLTREGELLGALPTCLITN